MSDKILQTPRISGRRHDLDWLRVIAFGCLIFYHTGMAYTTWHFHVESQYASKGPEYLLRLMSPWRLALLFFISGIAFRYISDRMSAPVLAGRRLVRLGLPIAFGMLVVVAPQTFMQIRQDGFIGPDYLAFYRDYLKPNNYWGIITPNWNHLWYVVYLLVYSLIFCAFLTWIRRFATGSGEKLINFMSNGTIRLLMLFLIPFLIYRVTLDPLFPVKMNLVDDWAHHAHRFTIFTIGYLVAKNDRFWAAVDKALPAAIVLLLGMGSCLSIIWDHGGAIYPKLADWQTLVLKACRTWYTWAVIIALLGLARKFLTRSSPALTYFNKAVFCWYILHQTIMIAAIFWLTQMNLGVWTEFALVVLITIGGCAIGYEIAKRLPFGLGILLGADPGRGNSEKKMTASPQS